MIPKVCNNTEYKGSYNSGRPFKMLNVDSCHFKFEKNHIYLLFYNFWLFTQFITQFTGVPLIF